jgi:hypothetical protein
MAGPFYFQPERVRRNTVVGVNERIDERIAENIREYAGKPVEAISARIAELERESDIERLLEINASAAALTGLALGTLVNKRWYLFSAGVLGFLLLHGIQGWCPPLPVLRRAGVRTRSEIDREKFALKYLRGDFDHIDDGNRKARVAKLAAATAL